MPAIAAVAADLLVRPRPVLCLDTCDLLDIVQCVAEGKANRLRHVSRLADILSSRPDELRIVVSYLVPLEWKQNLAAVVADVDRNTRGIDEAIVEIHSAWIHAGAPLAGAPPSYVDRGLPAALTALAERVLAWATELDQEEQCVRRALDRVHTKLRPSHKGMVKDSIHLEHYIELCGQLHRGGFTARRVLVSANKDDFWEAKNKSNVHPELKSQLSDVGLEFFGNLESALGSLGL